MQICCTATLGERFADFDAELEHLFHPLPRAWPEGHTVVQRFLNESRQNA
ncbi:MAG: hypothetical protein ABJN05_11075 [Sulfitobacter dubius]